MGCRVQGGRHGLLRDSKQGFSSTRQFEGGLAQIVTGSQAPIGRSHSMAPPGLWSLISEQHSALLSALDLCSLLGVKHLGWGRELNSRS